MVYSMLVPLGHTSTWLSREIISNRYEMGPIDDKLVVRDFKKPNMGSYWLFDRRVVVHPTSPGFNDEGGIDEWARKYIDNETKNIVGMGWCGSEIDNIVGRIAVPYRVALSPGFKKKKMIEGSGQANKALREDIIKEIKNTGYEILGGNACTYSGPDETSGVPGMKFADMEAGVLIRYGNNIKIPTACVYVVSDTRKENLKDHQFFERIKSDICKKPFETGLNSILNVLKK